MKMISSTRSTSISGVTLIFAWTRPLPPTFIAIRKSPYRCLAGQILSNRSCCGGLPRALRSFGNQADLIDARRAQIVDDVFHGLILGSGVRPDVHRFVEFIGQQILDFRRKVVQTYLLVAGAQEGLSVTRDGYKNRVFLIGVLHGDR